MYHDDIVYDPLNRDVSQYPNKCDDMADDTYYIFNYIICGFCFLSEKVLGGQLQISSSQAEKIGWMTRDVHAVPYVLKSCN